MQGAEVMSSRFAVAQNMPRLPARTGCAAARGRTPCRVEALAFPVTRTKDRLQSPPPPARFPDVDLSTAMPSPLSDQPVVARDATAQASISGVSVLQMLLLIARSSKLTGVGGFVSYSLPVVADLLVTPCSFKTWLEVFEMRLLGFLLGGCFATESVLLFVLLLITDTGSCYRADDLVYGTGRELSYPYEGDDQLLWLHVGRRFGSKGCWR
jgi:hypothetical protein